MTIFISVLYEEFKPETYRGVKAEQYRGKAQVVYSTNNFEDDYDKAVQWAHKNAKDGEKIYNTSSVDNYQQDKEE